MKEFSITKEAFDVWEFGADLNSGSYEGSATSLGFHALIAEAIRFMAETKNPHWHVGPVEISHPDRI